MLLLERDYQIQGAQKKKAYLIEKNMPAEGNAEDHSAGDKREK